MKLLSPDFSSEWRGKGDSGHTTSVDVGFSVDPGMLASSPSDDTFEYINGGGEGLGGEGWGGEGWLTGFMSFHCLGSLPPLTYDSRSSVRSFPNLWTLVFPFLSLPITFFHSP